MAMTGGTAYLVKSEKTNYGSNSWTTDLYIYVKVISQNVIANTSTMTLKRKCSSNSAVLFPL